MLEVDFQKGGCLNEDAMDWLSRWNICDKAI